MRVLALSFIFLVFLAVPAAFAQIPTVPQPTSALTVEMGPAPSTVASNTTPTITVTVSYSITNSACPPPGPCTATITPLLTTTGAPTFASATIAPASMDVSWNAGPISTTQRADFIITLAVKEITSNASMKMEVSASATAPIGAAPAPSAPSAAPVAAFANMTAPPPPPPVPVPVEESPGPGALMGIVAACAAAVIVRHRRR